MVKKTARNQIIRQQYAEGALSLEAIGQPFGLTKQRVSQISADLRHRQGRVRANVRIQQVYSYIVAYMQTHHGLPPTLTDIAAGLGFSKSNAFHFLQKLADQGRICFHPDIFGSSRNYYLPGATWTPPNP